MSNDRHSATETRLTRLDLIVRHKVNYFFVCFCFLFREERVRSIQTKSQIHKWQIKWPTVSLRIPLLN